MIQFLLLVSVLHYGQTQQLQPLNIETLQIQTRSCENAEAKIREYYANERYSRIVNLKCMRID